MNSFFREALGSAALAGVLALLSGGRLAAQAGPGFLVKPHPSFVLVNSFNSVPGTNIQHVHHVKLAGDPPGAWTTALTVAALPAYFGGDGKSTGVVLGRFEPRLGRFTVSLEAKALNSTADDRFLSLDPSGLVAVLERPDGVYVAVRSKLGAAFPAPRKVSGFGSLRSVHPYLGPVGGVLHCFFTDGRRILAQPIDPVKATLTGRPAVVSLPLQKGARPTFPSPLIGGDGDVEGLFLSEEVKARPNGDSDLLFAADLDPATPPVMVVQRSDYTNAATLAGGFLSFAHDILPRYHVMEAETAWLLGDVETPGGRADLTGAEATRLSAPVQASVVLLGAGLIPAAAVPGFFGRLGLNPAVLVPLGPVAHAGGADGTWRLSLPIPSDSRLKGANVPVQAVSFDAARKTPVFTNTAWIAIR